ncbi:MAG: CHAD domain-containing protein [Nitrososphaeraceae archaeon]|nr:CHAD domain-containing protein [Nitrososphaeraceae archaeon]
MGKNFSDQMIDRINKNFFKVNNILNLYIKNPDEKNIHDIRKSIRRAESAYVTLPEEYRSKKNFKEFIHQSKAFFKINSQIRDYDIYLQKIESFKKTDNGNKKSKNTPNSHISNSEYKSKNNDIVSEIQNLRKSKLLYATMVAEQLKNLEYPQIKDNNKKNSTKINSRFKKVTKKFTRKIQKNLPIVINDNSKVEELHTLRKDCKKLRYLLELKLELPDKNEDNPNNNDNDYKDLDKIIIKLEDIQDLLGQIHDCDALLSFFEKLEKFPETKSIIKTESENRKDLYQKFVNKFHQNTNLDILFSNIIK